MPLGLISAPSASPSIHSYLSFVQQAVLSLCDSPLSLVIFRRFDKNCAAASAASATPNAPSLGQEQKERLEREAVRTSNVDVRRLP